MYKLFQNNNSCTLLSCTIFVYNIFLYNMFCIMFPCSIASVQHVPVHHFPVQYFCAIFSVQYFLVLHFLYNVSCTAFPCAISLDNSLNEESSAASQMHHFLNEYVDTPFSSSTYFCIVVSTAIKPPRFEGFTFASFLPYGMFTNEWLHIMS